VTEVKGRMEIWKRYFDGKLSQTRMYDWNGQLIESFGALSLAIYPSVQPDGTITYTSYRCWFLGVPLPNILAPFSTWKETPTLTGWEFEGLISSHILGKILSYKGQFLIDQK